MAICFPREEIVIFEKMDNLIAVWISQARDFCAGFLRSQSSTMMSLGGKGEAGKAFPSPDFNQSRSMIICKSLLEAKGCIT